MSFPQELQKRLQSLPSDNAPFSPAPLNTLLAPDGEHAKKFGAIRDALKKYPRVQSLVEQQAAHFLTPFAKVVEHAEHSPAKAANAFAHALNEIPLILLAKDKTLPRLVEAAAMASDNQIDDVLLFTAQILKTAHSPSQPRFPAENYAQINRATPTLPTDYATFAKKAAGESGYWLAS